MEKKLYEDKYNLKNLHDLNEDYSSVFSNYLEKSKGRNKTDLFVNFVSKNLNKSRNILINFVATIWIWTTRSDQKS